MPTSLVSTPWPASASSSTRPRASSALRSSSWAVPLCSRLSGGSFHWLGPAAGPRSMASWWPGPASAGGGGKETWMSEAGSPAASGTTGSVEPDSAMLRLALSRLGFSGTEGGGLPTVDTHFTTADTAVAAPWAAVRIDVLVRMSPASPTTVPRTMKAPQDASADRSGPPTATPSRPPASRSSWAWEWTPGAPRVTSSRPVTAVSSRAQPMRMRPSACWERPRSRATPLTARTGGRISRAQPTAPPAASRMAWPAGPVRLA
jgi:hypothetical protein